jgi:CheY-like chemotaxis protein
VNPRRRVLLIDDDVGVTRLLSLGLEDTGRFEVHAAHTGQEGLREVRAFAPEIVVLDMIMPDMRGSQVLAGIRDDPALGSTPVIFLTAVAPDGESPRLHGCECLAKPVTAHQVLRAIERALARN